MAQRTLPAILRGSGTGLLATYDPPTADVSEVVAGTGQVVITATAPTNTPVPTPTYFVRVFIDGELDDFGSSPFTWTATNAVEGDTITFEVYSTQPGGIVRVAGETSITCIAEVNLDQPATFGEDTRSGWAGFQLVDSEGDALTNVSDAGTGTASGYNLSSGGVVTPSSDGSLTGEDGNTIDFTSDQGDGTLTFSIGAGYGSALVGEVQAFLNLNVAEELRVRPGTAASRLSVTSKPASGIRTIKSQDESNPPLFIGVSFSGGAVAARGFVTFQGVDFEISDASGDSILKGAKASVSVIGCDCKGPIGLTYEGYSVIYSMTIDGRCGFSDSDIDIDCTYRGNLIHNLVYGINLAGWGNLVDGNIFTAVYRDPVTLRDPVTGYGDISYHNHIINNIAYNMNNDPNVYHWDFVQIYGGVSPSDGSFYLNRIAGNIVFWGTEGAKMPQNYSASFQYGPTYDATGTADQNTSTLSYGYILVDASGGDVTLTLPDPRNGAVAGGGQSGTTIDVDGLTFQPAAADRVRFGSSGTVCRVNSATTVTGGVCTLTLDTSVSPADNDTLTWGEGFVVRRLDDSANQVLVSGSGFTDEELDAQAVTRKFSANTDGTYTLASRSASYIQGVFLQGPGADRGVNGLVIGGNIFIGASSWAVGLGNGGSTLVNYMLHAHVANNTAIPNWPGDQNGNGTANEYEDGYHSGSSITKAWAEQLFLKKNISNGAFYTDPEGAGDVSLAADNDVFSRSDFSGISDRFDVEGADLFFPLTPAEAIAAATPKAGTIVPSGYGATAVWDFENGVPLQTAATLADISAEDATLTIGESMTEIDLSGYATGDDLSFVFSGLPDGATGSWDGKINGTITDTAGTFDVEVTAANVGGFSTTRTLTLTVEAAATSLYDFAATEPMTTVTGTETFAATFDGWTMTRGSNSNPRAGWDLSGAGLVDGDDYVLVATVAGANSTDVRTNGYSSNDGTYLTGSAISYIAGQTPDGSDQIAGPFTYDEDHPNITILFFGETATEINITGVSIVAA